METCKEQTGLAKNVIVGVVYRPPNTDLEMFINYMSEILSIVKSENKLMYLMGDYNVNLLNIDNHMLTSEFLEMFYSNSFLPVINKPARVTCNSATLIDNIYCNNFGNGNLFCGILYTDLTDLFPIFCMLSSNNTQLKEIITKREYTVKEILINFVINYRIQIGVILHLLIIVRILLQNFIISKRIYIMNVFLLVTTK